ncbi:hypothetical protein [Beduinella massiliensis]|uniref:hypothetical protein n=1 Tax=Beduinella massiliensis TaxID=1852363 RepID=UPI000C866D6E
MKKYYARRAILAILVFVTFLSRTNGFSTILKAEDAQSVFFTLLGGIIWPVTMFVAASILAIVLVFAIKYAHTFIDWLWGFLAFREPESAQNCSWDVLTGVFDGLALVFFLVLLAFPNIIF